MSFFEDTLCSFFLPREEINSQLDWLYTNEVCAYPVLQGGATAKVREASNSFLLDIFQKGV